MAGGILQVQIYGAEDTFLTGTPQITFFRSVYRRHTHFAVESRVCAFNSPEQPFGQSLTVPIRGGGDLLHRVYLEVTLPGSGHRNTETSAVDKWAYVRNLGHVLIREASVKIGDTVIDTTYGRFQNMWTALTMRADKKRGFFEMTGVDTDPITSDTALELTAETTFYIPIDFWFTAGFGQALPLIAMQNSDLVLEIKLASVRDIIRGIDGNERPYDPQTLRTGFTQSPVAFLQPRLTNLSLKIYADFIFLDVSERRRFGQSSHEYLIHQIQKKEQSTATLSRQGDDTTRIDIPFSHPIKFLMWSLCRPEGEEYTLFNPFYNGLIDPERYPALSATDLRHGSNNNPVESVQLFIDNQPRFEPRKGSYFSLVQPYQHAPVVPENNWLGLYSFALSIDEFQPSGTLNLSKASNCRLDITTKNPTTALQDISYTNIGSEQYNVHVYTMNLNVIRITSGQVGLAFAT